MNDMQTINHQRQQHLKYGNSSNSSKNIGNNSNGCGNNVHVKNRSSSTSNINITSNSKYNNMKRNNTLKYFPFSDNVKYNSLEESFRGHYKRRTALASKAALPCVIGNDTSAFINNSRRNLVKQQLESNNNNNNYKYSNHHHGRRHKPHDKERHTDGSSSNRKKRHNHRNGEQYQLQDETRKDIWKATVEDNNITTSSNSLHDKVLASLRQKNISKDKQKYFGNRTRNTVYNKNISPHENLSESSSSTTESSEEDSESMADYNSQTSSNNSKDHDHAYLYRDHLYNNVQNTVKENGKICNFAHEHNTRNKKIADKARDSNLSLPKLQQDQYLSSNINAIEQKSDNELSVYERIRKMTSKKDFDDNNNSGKSSGKFSGKSHATLSHKNMKFKIHPQAESGSIVTMDNIHKHNNSISNNGNDRMNSISYSKSYAQVALPPSQKQTGSSSSLNFDDGNTMNSTKDLLKEYKMIIKWREKQQIALQQRLEDLYGKYNNLIQSSAEEKQKYTEELEALSKKVNAQTQKNSVLVKSHFKKEQSIEKLADMLDKERNGFAKERETMLNNLKQSKKLVGKYKNEVGLLKEKYDQKLLELVDAAAESHFCPWNTSMEEISSLLPPPPPPISTQNRKKLSKTTTNAASMNKKKNVIDRNDHRLKHATDSTDDSEIEDAFESFYDDTSDDDIDYNSKLNKKKSIVNTDSDGNLCTHIEKNDLQGLLIEVEMLKCELDSNQEALSRYRRANTILKRDAHSADHISKSEKCFDTQSQSCQVNIDEINSLAKLKDEAKHIAEAKIKQLELCESSIFENVKNKVCSTIASSCICSCCNEIYNKPQMIDPCGHTFCAECIATTGVCYVCNCTVNKTTSNVILESLCCNLLVDICSKRVKKDME